jgi:hypothetical protein
MKAEPEKLQLTLFPPEVVALGPCPICKTGVLSTHPGPTNPVVVPNGRLICDPCAAKLLPAAMWAWVQQARKVAAINKAAERKARIKEAEIMSLNAERKAQDRKSVV